MILAAIAFTASLTIGVCAHRGAGQRAPVPENTLAAVRMGLSMGADMIEVDVRRTKDGILVLHHDESINRMAFGKGLVRDLTLAQISALRIGRQWWAKFPNEKPVPTLDEALALIAAHPTAVVCLDMKDPADAAAARAAAIRAGLADRHVIWGNFRLRRSMLAGRRITISDTQSALTPEAVRGALGHWTYVLAEDVPAAVRDLRKN